MKFGQLIGYNKMNHAENKGERLVPKIFLFFLKALFEVKASGLQLRINIL